MNYDALIKELTIAGEGTEVRSMISFEGQTLEIGNKKIVVDKDNVQETKKSINVAIINGWLIERSDSLFIIAK